jgi:branched-chain amino acid transport system substrate-binding protein
MSDSTQDRNTRRNGKSRREVLRMAGTGGAAAAVGFPPVGVARADSAKLKIGYISCMSGPRTDFGATAPWVLDRIKAVLKDGLKIGGKNYAVEFILKDNQSDPNQTNVVAKELILGEKCDLVLTDDGENIAGAADELADARGVPLISTLSPWEAWFFGRHGSPDKGFPFTFHYCIGAGDVFNLYANMWNTVKSNKVVGTMYMDSPAGRGFSDPQHGLPPILKKYDYKEVPTGYFQITNDDFSNQIAAMKAGDASIITGTCYPNHFTTFWNQAAQSGLKPDIVTVAGPFLFPSGVEALGDHGDGMSTEVLWNPHLPLSFLADRAERAGARRRIREIDREAMDGADRHRAFALGSRRRRAQGRRRAKEQQVGARGHRHAQHRHRSRPALFRKISDQERRRTTADRRTMAQSQIRQIQIRIVDRQRRHIECETGRRIQAVVATRLIAALRPWPLALRPTPGRHGRNAPFPLRRTAGREVR